MYSNIHQVYIQDQLSLVAHSNDGLNSRKTSKRESKNENIPTLNVMAGHNVMCTPELKVMQPLLRLLQLFCENHNTDMQVLYISSYTVFIYIMCRITFDIRRIVKIAKT